MKKFLIVPLCLAVVLMAGCTGPGGFADVVRNADTANKHIKAEFSGWNAHMSYESWPAAFGTTNSDSLIITPTTTLNSSRAVK